MTSGNVRLTGKFGSGRGVAILLLVFLSSTVGISSAEEKQAPAQTEAQPSKTKAKMPSSGAGLMAKGKSVPRSQYAGDAACAGCHQDITDAYEKTPHYLTSRVADKDSIVGDFRPGANTMTTGNPSLSFRMDAKGEEFFQTAIWTYPSGAPTSSASSSPPPATRTRTERLDLVIGSGGKGQTYLYWRGDELFQLPVGYSTVLHRWINSPGFADGTANFERPIIPRCLECHAAYFEALFPGPDFNVYDTKNFVLGISCERCHGPGRAHAESYNSKAPGRKAVIVNPAKLSPARRSDVCAQCHGGQGEREILPAFTYIPGQPLERYIDLGPIDSASDIDVHGKQGKLLMKSRCYQVSGTMNCSTCHDVHKQDPGLAAMSQHCLSCHEVRSSPTHAKVGADIAKNCIDCHMPRLQSKVVDLDVDGKKVRPRFRTHWIKIYSDAERQ